MKIILVSGFLGSGKTTTIIEMAHFLTDQEHARLAVVVNEAGDIPMDGAVLTAGGNWVKEIYAGCICCQVATSLVDAVRELHSLETLDYLVIEPSGLADPQRIREILALADETLWLFLYILDAPRYDLLLKAAKPSVTNGIRGADVVLVNKSDGIKAGRMEEICAGIKALKSDVVMMPVSARNGISPQAWQWTLSHGG